MIALTKKFFNDHKLGIILTTIGLVFYQWTLVSLYPMMQKIDIEALLKNYPKAFLAFFGGTELSFTSLEGFFNTEYLSLMYMIIVAGYLITLVTSELTKEVENGTLESLLSLPVSRATVLGYKYVNITLLTAFFTIIGIVPFMLMSVAYDFSFSIKAFLMVTLLTFLFFMAIAALTTALSVFFNERNKPTSIVLFILGYGYILNSLGQAFSKVKNYRFLGIFYYYSTAKTLGHKTIATNSYVVFGTIIIVSTIFAFYWFNKRDFAN
ncbi:MAG: hypothetical protein C4562_06300 [Actinobacteria bacterium]|nr:MAG: hypothetical protein C4562_06300 [Actinomycetota bacterium]